MNLTAVAAELLSRRLGLSPELLGDDVVERALNVVFAKASPKDHESNAARLLEEKGQEWQILVDEIIVPETWFFRHKEAFRFLATYVTEKWRPANLTRPFRVLCIPCASGEEPYSIVMALLDAGLDASRIRIDAADISERLLARARLAVYGKTSFREEFGSSREKYFVNCEEGWKVRDEVTQLVRFEKANLLDLASFRQRAPYDAIFCRNALIYLNERARHEVVSQMHELLHDEGLLFTGASEVTHFCEAGYVPVDYPQSFACRKGKCKSDRLPARRAAATAATVKGRLATPRRATAPLDANRPVEARPPSKPPPSLEQAERLADRGELDAAAAICERLLASRAREPGIYALLGVINESRGAIESAEEFFRKALYLAPNHYESLLHMSLLCERLGDVEGARRYRARAGRALSQQEEDKVLKGL